MRGEPRPIASVATANSPHWQAPGTARMSIANFCALQGAGFRLIRSEYRRSDEAMDLTQETFVAGFAALARYDGGPAVPDMDFAHRDSTSVATGRGAGRCGPSSRARLPLESAHDVASDGPAPDAEAADRLNSPAFARRWRSFAHNLREVSGASRRRGSQPGRNRRIYCRSARRRLRRDFIARARS
jgi:hypothetical protein